MHRLDVLMVQAAAIEGYPPTINQANLLAEAGIRVGVLSMWHPELEDEAIFHPSVLRWRGARQWLSYKEPLPLLWVRLVRRQIFAMKLKWFRRRFRPRIEIGYDALACRYLGPPSRNEATTIWHLHEHLDHRLAVSHSIQVAHDFIRRGASDADLVVVPDSFRAQAMMDAGLVKKMPTVVMNCPRRLENLPESILQARLKTLGVNVEDVVLYQGSISEIQCADIAVRSMPFWPANSTLVFLGPLKAEWKRKIYEFAQACGRNISDRIVILPPVKYRSVFNYTVGAQIGLGLIKPSGDHYKYSCGASNKRFEYMACRIPQVVNTGPGMKELVEKTGLGICVNPESPEAVGRAVEYLLENGEESRRIGERARRAHLEKYNYELQFEPVRQRIMDFLN